MKNNKGFTLIELLAVIIILAIIALIATPIVLNTLDEAKRGAAIDSGYYYMESVEHSIATAMISNPSMSLSGTFNGTEFVISDENKVALTINHKGTAPTTVSLTFTGGKVTTGTMTVNGYDLVVTDGKITVK